MPVAPPTKTIGLKAIFFQSFGCNYLQKTAYMQAFGCRVKTEVKRSAFLFKIFLRPLRWKLDKQAPALLILRINP